MTNIPPLNLTHKEIADFDGNPLPDTAPAPLPDTALAPLPDTALAPQPETKTLRDEFAMAALVTVADEWYQDECAKWAYMVADAMMEARKAREAEL